MRNPLTNPPSTTAKTNIWTKLDRLVVVCFSARQTDTDESFDDWFFCVVKRIGCFPEDVWTKTINDKGAIYRGEQQQKLQTSILISVCGAKTLQDLNNFDEQVELALKGCPGCGVQTHSGQDGGSSEEPRKELTPEQASKETSPKL